MEDVGVGVAKDLVELDRTTASAPAPYAIAWLRGAPQSGLPLYWGLEGPHLPENSNRAAFLAVKRAVDVILTLAALVALSPLLLTVAAAIKLTSRGPVFFRQLREGKDGTHFGVFKFRSMFVDRGDLSGVKQTTTNDPRVTPLGRFLRKTSIDELPQLLNILKGDMSLVGPRPHPIQMRAAGTVYRDLVPYYDLRLAVRPGLTGWAQANGYRGPTDNATLARARVNHDIAYIQHMSLWLDIKIIWMTLVRELSGGTGL